MNRPARPGRVTRLNPNFTRWSHLGPVTRPQAVARIEKTALLTWRASTERQGEARAS